MPSGYGAAQRQAEASFGAGSHGACPFAGLRRDVLDGDVLVEREPERGLSRRAQELGKNRLVRDDEE